ncbi:MAG: hypothetical protein RIQ56_664 [Candidatus Parcubacteria bacterium]
MMTPRLTEYPTARNCVFVFLVTYALIGFGAHIFSKGQEDVYPFFSWFLFVQVPQRIQDGYEVRVTILSGEKKHSSPLLQESIGASTSLNYPAREVIRLGNELGRALKQGEDARVLAYRTLLEAMLTKPCEYEVREVRYDPREYYLSKTTKETLVLARYTCLP